MGIFDFLDFFQLPARLLSQHAANNVLYHDSLNCQPRKTRPTPSNPSRTMHMPLEVVIHILNFACDNEDTDANKLILSNCALVCKDWSFVAQEILFRDVTLQSNTASKSFAAAINSGSPRGRSLAGYVKGLNCVLDTKQPDALSQDACAETITSCPNLRTVRLALYGASMQNDGQHSRVTSSASSFDEVVLAALRTGPRIDALHFNNWSDDQTALSQLLSALPFISSLSIGGNTPLLHSPTGEPFPCALHELRLNFQTTPSVEFLEWLLHNSKTTLRSLEFEREPSSSLLEYLILEHHSTLESLALPACASSESTSLLARCSQLRELRLESAWIAPGVRREFPSTLERLALVVDKDTALQPVVQAIKRSQALSSVTLHVWTGGEHHPQLAAMKIACAIRGIHFKVIRDIQVFRTIKRGYPIFGIPFCCSTKSMK